MHEFFKVFFINLVCDIDNMLILGAILRRHSYLNMTIPAAIVLTFMRTVYVILINEGLSGIPLFQLLTGLVLLFIAFKVVTMTISGEDLLSRSTRSPKSKVNVLLLLMGTDFLISLDSVFVISGISQTIFPVATGIFGSLMISLLFMSIIIRLAKAFFWINIIAGGFIAQNAMIGMSKDPWLADWISQINQSFPNVNIVNIAANGAVILIVVIGVYSYIKHHRIIIDK
ncbi:TerC family protein [Heyndrickxia sp. FSL W8-0423]|uniref:TerC family protein n=1 Tax=Heyndrickxia sp. FSL W8-0423 TaxID=2921601 RepID=UPI0030FCCCCC